MENRGLHYYWDFSDDSLVVQWVGIYLKALLQDILHLLSLVALEGVEMDILQKKKMKIQEIDCLLDPVLDLDADYYSDHHCYAY